MHTYVTLRVIFTDDSILGRFKKKTSCKLKFCEDSSIYWLLEPRILSFQHHKGVHYFISRYLRQIKKMRTLTWHFQFSFSEKIKILEEMLGATRRVRGPSLFWSVKTTGKCQYLLWKINNFYRNFNLMTPTLPTSRWKRGRNRWCLSLLSEPFDWSLGHLIEEWPRWNIWSVIII
jgi:hypothetical protein